ncbi:hypothetical protein BH24DEI2_BH24DEI2_20630 [soil metagenome]
MQSHLQSILALIETQNYRDADLIARVMIEGIAYLRWAAEKPEIRAYRWRAFAWLVDLKNLQQQDCLGENVDLEYKQRVLEKIDKHEQILLKPKYLDIDEKDIPSDPEKRYIKDWFVNELGEKAKLKDIVESTSVSEALWSIYERTSDRVHWQIEDIKINRESHGNIFVEQQKVEVWDCCSVAIFALRASLDLLVARLNLHRREHLEMFDVEFQKFVDVASQTDVEA